MALLYLSWVRLVYAIPLLWASWGQINWLHGDVMLGYVSLGFGKGGDNVKSCIEKSIFFSGGQFLRYGTFSEWDV